MPANTSPIFTLLPQVEWDTAGALTAANTTKDGSSGTTQTVFTAGSNGSFVQKLIARAAGTNVATVLRVFVNNGSVTSSAVNNKLIGEMTLPATTLSEVAALAPYELPLNVGLPPSFRIFVTIGTAVSAGYHVSAVGGDY